MIGSPTITEETLHRLAQRHGFEVAAVRHMFEALQRGHGRMAQFDHPAFSGPGQWQRRGSMTMISDMFNDGLKRRVDALCRDLSGLAPLEPGAPAPFERKVRRPNDLPRSGDWWPGGMGHPNSAGSQNGLRYAYFARARRLAIERGGEVSLYDTQDHDIGGVSQQQGPGGTLVFTSPQGPVDLASLPLVSPPRDR